MKPSRYSLLAALCLAGILPGSVVVAPAQFHSEPVKGDSVAAAVADAQGLPLVPHDQLPWFGTFWMAQNSVPCVTAPLPCPPLDPGVPVYALSENQFLVDETGGPLLWRRGGKTTLSSADYASLIQWQAEDLLRHITFIQEAELRAQMRTLDGDGPPLPPGGGGGGGGGGDTGTNSPPIYTLGLGLCLYPPIVTSNSITIIITNTPDSGWLTNSYDLFYTTNMASLPEPALCLTNWAWLARSTPGQTSFVINNPGFAECYFRLGTMQDSDNDGLTDAYERLVSHTDPANWDTDGDSLFDGWELQNGMNPRLNESAQTSGRMNYQYDGSGWLREVLGAVGEGINLDNEGNVLTAQ